MYKTKRLNRCIDIKKHKEGWFTSISRQVKLLFGFLQAADPWNTPIKTIQSYVPCYMQGTRVFMVVVFGWHDSDARSQSDSETGEELREQAECWLLRLTVQQQLL